MDEKANETQSQAKASGSQRDRPFRNGFGCEAGELKRDDVRVFENGVMVLAAQRRSREMHLADRRANRYLHSL